MLTRRHALHVGRIHGRGGPKYLFRRTVVRLSQANDKAHNVLRASLLLPATPTSRGPQVAYGQRGGGRKLGQNHAGVVHHGLRSIRSKTVSGVSRHASDTALK